jgi:two-component system NarL family sensor kinase
MSSPSDAETLARRNRELSILNAIAEALNREVDLSRALRVALARVTELFHLHTGWVFLMDEVTGKTYLETSQNLPPVLSNEPKRMEGTCYCLDSYLDGDLKGAANVNIIECSRLEKLVDGTDGLRYHASIPLYAYGKKLGVFNVASADWRELAPDDLRLLYTVGDLLAMAIERARLFAKSAQVGAVEERNRLAREIHDTLAQGLSAITLQLEAADALLEASANSPRARQAVQQALTLTRANLEEARRSVLDLRAAPLEGRTLVEALQALAREWSAQWNLPTQCVIVGAPRPLPVRIEVGLYRIAQEALTNVVRHAQAKRLTVKLLLSPEQAALHVEDDGRGFEPTQIPKGRFGLIGLSERAKLLGGHLHVRSSVGAGTWLEVVVPLEA